MDGEATPPPASCSSITMRLIIVAVGTRMPAWVSDGFNEFAKRMPRECPMDLIEVKPENRTSGKPPQALMQAEALRIRSVIPKSAKLVVLDEHGEDYTSVRLSQKLDTWRSDGQDIAFVIGGPDGLADDLKTQAHATMRLSSLTLPHAMVRVILAEALYRAWSITQNHPYHRE